MSAGNAYGGGPAPAGALMVGRYVRCVECRRQFDLTLDLDADEWAYGHDCEEA